MRIRLSGRKESTNLDEDFRTAPTLSTHECFASAAVDEKAVDIARCDQDLHGTTRSCTAVFRLFRSQQLQSISVIPRPLPLRVRQPQDLPP